MIHAFLVMLFAASPSPFDPNAGRFPQSVFQTHMPADEEASTGGRWENAGVQFIAGTAGASIGSLGGAFVGGLAGYIIGEGVSSKKDRCEEEVEGEGRWCIPASVGTAVLGGMIGASALGVWTSAKFVSLTAPESHPSSGIGIGVMGSMLGAMGGFTILGVTSNSMDWQFWPGFAVVMASSSAGALAFDRSFAVPRRLSLSPWVPRPGLNGAMLSMEL